MGCDWFADENGEFEILIEDYENPRVLQHVKICGLKPRHQIQFDILKGDER